MLIAIKEMLDQEEIQELIGYSVFPDEEKINQAIELYEKSDHLIMGYSVNNEIIGVIGYEKQPNESIKLNHISIQPESRDMGYGRLMISELIDLIKPNKIIAETDEESVDFYRKIGFEIISLGEKYPGVERYKCTFVTDFKS